MSLRPFFSFYGAKWRTAKHYPRPVHDTIIEPFAGSAGYALRYPNRKVILVELDPRVAGVWRYLLRVQPAEILALPDPAPGQCRDDLPVCEEARWLIGFWFNKGAPAPRNVPSAWMRSRIRRNRSGVRRSVNGSHHSSKRSDIGG